MLSTVGYERSSLNDFIETLKIAKVEVLIDVRERAQSRRRGFSKTALAEALDEAGMEYLHFRELGDPKEGREAARAGEFTKFRRIYANVLKRTNAKRAIAEIIDIVGVQNVCLLCYERDPMTCHRKIITDKIEKSAGIKAKHLGVTSIESPSRPKRRVLHTRESIAAQI